MFEEHTIQEPGWIRTLVEDVLVDSVEPLGFIGPLGYRWWEPGNTNNQFDGWQLAVFPTPNEVRGPVPQDGCKYVSGFQLNVAKILEVMSNVENLIWHAPVAYTGDFDGPEFSVQGHFAGKHVWLRFFHLPPPDEPCSYFVNPQTGEAWEKPV